ncbi:hypothetical protein [Streptomyces sp. NPDC093707]|uniref:hypothetical protein n=1 Tax=Streptomyces sp. NPDC093707 TaxID=3154984 RepID=UPI00344DBA9B
MRKSMDRTGRGAVCALAALALSAALTSASATPPAGETSRIPFAERFHATGHGGFARAAHSLVTCRPAERAGRPSCAAARRSGRDAGPRTAYLDVDDDPRTVGSSRAALRMPAGSRVRYARLYWGGDLPVDGRRTARGEREMLLAGPRDRYREVRADGPIGRRTTARTDAYQASADVTALVRRSGAGTYTVARPRRARERARAGAWGGWALIVAYENPREPLRRLALWDGFEALGGHRRALAVEMAGLRIPAHARGRAGIVAYHGAPGDGGKISARAGRTTPVALRDSAEPGNAATHSARQNFGRKTPGAPVYRAPAGFDSGLFDLTPALRSGGDRLVFRFTTRKAGYLLGAFFVQADLRR